MATFMQFDIVHTTRYAYSRDVFIEPHEVRMRPRNCGAQSLKQFALEVSPTPAGISHCIDVEGNNVSCLWFDGVHSELKITTCSRVQCDRDNPYDYLLRTSDYDLPLKYDPTTTQLLDPVRQYRFNTEQEDELVDFAAELSRNSDGQLLGFLNLLNDCLYLDFKCVHRELGDAWPAVYTLSERRGACRDLAVLFIALCRCLNIAARFVSGYQEGDTKQERRELHAWVEVYVPGAGWRGYDPTHGLVVADRHVAVAASVSPQLAAPLIGSFRGNDVTMRMDTEIELQVNQTPQLFEKIQ